MDSIRECPKCGRRTGEWNSGHTADCPDRNVVVMFKREPFEFEEHPGPTQVQMVVPNRWVSKEDVEQKYPRVPCPRDTNGDGNCGQPACPHCGPFKR